MHREMRRKERQASDEETTRLLEKGEYGILATVDAANLPYAVPLSYIYVNNCIYFHCAVQGHKLDNIKANPKVSFCVVGDTKILPDKFSTVFESAIAFGTAVMVEDEAERISALQALVEKYSASFQNEGKEYIARAGAMTSIVRINIEHLTGKKRAE